MEKIILIICDGMGDLPIKDLGNKTPLEAANKPNIDRLARGGISGFMHVLGKGTRPNSDQAHLTIFGYDLKKDYPGRGPIEAAGAGIRLNEGDVALRSNLATVDYNLIVKDRRAGRISDASEFTKDLDGIKINGVEFIVKAGTGYRVIIVMRGSGLSDKISNSDVHYITSTNVIEDWEGHKVNPIRPLDKSKEAEFTAGTLQAFLERAHEILENHPYNKKLEKEGKLKGNYLLTRGPGYYKHIEPFIKKWGLKSACIAGAGLYKGLGVMAGMELIEAKGATGLPDTDVLSKFKKAKAIIKDYDFVFVHVKPTDIFGENGDCLGKKGFIESKIDPALGCLMDFKGIIAITADHSTPCSQKDHSGDPVPVLVHGPGIKHDLSRTFSEKESRKGSLGEMYGKDFMKTLLDLSGS